VLCATTRGGTRENPNGERGARPSPPGVWGPPPRTTIQAVSSALPLRYACRYASGTGGCASIIMPGSPSWTPASHDPDLSIFPPGRYAAVLSPRYQTLPCLSCAYQSVVFSSSFPRCVEMSDTAVALMPSM